MFTSDNGGTRSPAASNLPLRGYKGTTWEGGQRVPCLLRWPGVIPAGQRCADVTTAMDFLPTFANLSGTTAPNDRVIDGRDLTPLFRGGTVAGKPFLYYLGDQLHAIRDGDWKLHLLSGELYHLAATLPRRPTSPQTMPVW